MNRREILFRGKRVDNGEYVYGHYSVLYTKSGSELLSTHYIMFQIAGHGVQNVRVHKDSVGQYVGLTDKNGVKIFERMELRVKHAIGDECGCFVDAIYKVDRLTCEGLGLSLVRLFSNTPDARSNSHPIHQTLSFNHSSLTTDYRNSNYDRIAVNETYGENSLSLSQWKENHYSNNIEVFEDLTQQS